ncbi:MAG: hypothetical protein AAF335_02200 [Bacteroidota bacterium]
MSVLLSYVKKIFIGSMFLCAAPLVASKSEGPPSFSVEAFRRETNDSLSKMVYDALEQYKDTFHTVKHYYAYNSRKYTKVGGGVWLVMAVFLLTSLFFFDLYLDMPDRDYFKSVPSLLFRNISKIDDRTPVRRTLYLCIMFSILASTWVVPWYIYSSITSSMNERRLADKIKESKKSPGAIILTDNSMISVFLDKGVAVTEVRPYKNIYKVEGDQNEKNLYMLGEKISISASLLPKLHNLNISQEELADRQAFISFHNNLIKQVIFALDIKKSMIFIIPYSPKAEIVSWYEIEYFFKEDKEKYPSSIQLSELVDEEGRGISVDTTESEENVSSFVIWRGVRWSQIVFMVAEGHIFAERLQNKYLQKAFFRYFLDDLEEDKIKDMDFNEKVYAIFSQTEEGKNLPYYLLECKKKSIDGEV